MSRPARALWIEILPFLPKPESRKTSRPARALWIINERIITVVGAIMGKSDFVKRCNCTDITKNRFKHQIKNDDIFLTYISRLLPMEKTAYEFVH